MSLVILSTARTLTVQKFGGVRLVKRKMFIACIFTWTIAIGSVLSYMAYLYMQHLRLRNNMCIILGISHRRNVSWFEHIFQIVVVALNALSVLLLTMCSVILFSIIAHSNKTITQLSGSTFQNTRVLRL